MSSTIRSVLGPLAFLLLTSALPACSDDEAPACPAAATTGGLPLLGADCDPLVPTQCGYPFPSNVYLADDPTMPTGKHVMFGATTLPRASGKVVDPAILADRDGFSPGSTLLTHLPGATATGLPTQDTLPLSITTDSPTIVLDAETGELVPHFSEIDMSFGEDEALDRAFLIRPVVRLRDSARYIVAIRHVVSEGGEALAPSATFQALRDGTELCEPSVALRRELYADIFAKLEAAGIGRGDLQLAWDFSTASRENTTGRLLAMRDEALAEVGDAGPEYTIDGVDPDPNPHIRLRIRGTMQVPHYVDSTEPGAKLVLDESGKPKRQGLAGYPFVVHVPVSIADGEPGGLLQNGHGLIGFKEEGQDDYLAEIADVTHRVAFAVDWIGMAHDDLDSISEAIVYDISKFKDVVGRQHQGFLNALLAMRMMKGRFTEEPLLQFGGKSGIDPTEVAYRGDSQGGIFGTTYMALSTDVTRGLVSVPGMTYSLILNRSQDFGLYFVLLRSSYDTSRNVQLVIGLVQSIWDRTEPDGYAPYITSNMLPGTPEHAILIHPAIGDHQVTPLGAHLIARTVGAKNLAPTNREVFGVEEAPAPITGSALVEFDFGLPPAPITNIPPTEGADPHNEVRYLPDAYLQADEFFRTGVVNAYCDGPCDPE